MQVDASGTIRVGPVHAVALASVGRRIVARLIDGVLVCAAAALVTIAVLGFLHLAWFGIVWIALTLAYDLVSVAGCGRQFGKWIMRICVVDAATGRKPRFPDALVRSITLMLMLVVAQIAILVPVAADLFDLSVFAFASIPLAVVSVATLATIYRSRFRQSCHDKSARTLVVLDSSPDQD